jgi:hypothetical protein
MSKRLPLGEGNSLSEGLIDIMPVRRGCSLFVANLQQPPPEDGMAVAIANVPTKSMAQQSIMILRTLPLTKGGNTVGLFVGWETIGPPSPESLSFKVPTPASGR